MGQENRQGNPSHIPVSQWVTWISMLIGAMFALLTHADNKYVSKEVSEVQNLSVEQRLSRIERKIDLILEKR